jgi:hypothetical protein
MDGDSKERRDCRQERRFRKPGAPRHPAFCLLAVSCAVVPLFGLAVSAQPAYPDLRGTWTGTADQVMLDPDGAGASFKSGPVALVVSDQRDRRFAGELDVHRGEQKLKFDIVGVFTSETEFAWTETEGFVTGRMIDNDTIETCYLRVGADSGVAACETMMRQE